MLSCILLLGNVLSLLFVAKAGETIQDAAVIARGLVEKSIHSVGTMATVFPSDHATLAGQPFALQEYYASCYNNGSLTLLFLPISRHSQNILHSPSRSASISVWSEKPAASRARVSLIGNITIFDDTLNVPDVKHMQSCYLEKHPDARKWLPDDDDAPHIAYWAQFEPISVYFVGGFGDEHYIGYIPLDIYRNVTLSDSTTYLGLLLAQET